MLAEHPDSLKAVDAEGKTVLHDEHKQVDQWIKELFVKKHRDLVWAVDAKGETFMQKYCATKTFDDPLIDNDGRNLFFYGLARGDVEKYYKKHLEEIHRRDKDGKCWSWQKPLADLVEQDPSVLDEPGISPEEKARILARVEVERNHRW